MHSARRRTHLRTYVNVLRAAGSPLRQPACSAPVFTTSTHPTPMALRSCSSRITALGAVQYSSAAATTSAAAFAAGGAKQHADVPPSEQRLLIVAIIGLPNAGKSTLVNRLLGTKISGVSSKRNTTITPQLGCFTSGPAQVLLYDTPGLVQHSVQGSPLQRLKSAWATAGMADQLLFIVDAERQFRLREPELLKLAQQLAAGPPTSLLQGWQQPPAALFLNKEDKLQPHIRDVALQQLGQQLGGIARLEAVFQGAAMLGEGVDELRRYFIGKARPGLWLVPPDQAHTAPPGDLAVELVREKLYRRLNQELPYALTVQADSVRPLLGSKQGLAIHITVLVKNRRMRSIVVGKGGSIIQGYVAQPTEAELTRILGAPVRLTVSVKALTDG